MKDDTLIKNYGNMAMEEQLTCQTGLQPGIIDKEVFDRELKLCQQLSSENKGKCGWGSCEKCGVIPLLYKLHKGMLLEEPSAVQKAKDSVLVDGHTTTD